MGPPCPSWLPSAFWRRGWRRRAGRRAWVPWRRCSSTQPAPSSCPLSRTCAFPHPGPSPVEGRSSTPLPVPRPKLVFIYAVVRRRCMSRPDPREAQLERADAAATSALTVRVSTPGERAWRRGRERESPPPAAPPPIVHLAPGATLRSRGEAGRQGRRPLVPRGAVQRGGREHDRLRGARGVRRGDDPLPRDGSSETGHPFSVPFSRYAGALARAPSCGRSHSCNA